MNVLDENIRGDQRRLLEGWRIRVRQIGHDIGLPGMADEEILSLLHQEIHGSRRMTVFWSPS